MSTDIPPNPFLVSGFYIVQGIYHCLKKGIQLNWGRNYRYTHRPMDMTHCSTIYLHFLYTVNFIHLLIIDLGPNCCFSSRSFLLSFDTSAPKWLAGSLLQHICQSNWHDWHESPEGRRDVDCSDMISPRRMGPLCCMSHSLIVFMSPSNFHNPKI